MLGMSTTMRLALQRSHATAPAPQRREVSSGAGWEAGSLRARPAARAAAEPAAEGWEAGLEAAATAGWAEVEGAAAAVGCWQRATRQACLLLHARSARSTHLGDGGGGLGGT